MPLIFVMLLRIYSPCPCRGSNTGSLRDRGNYALPKFRAAFGGSEISPPQPRPSKKQSP